MMLRGRSMARNAYDRIGCSFGQTGGGGVVYPIQRSMERPCCPFMIQNTWAWGRRPHVSDLNPLKFLPKNPYLGCNSNIHRSKFGGRNRVLSTLRSTFSTNFTDEEEDISISSYIEPALAHINGDPCPPLSFMQNVQHLPPFRVSELRAEKQKFSGSDIMYVHSQSDRDPCANIRFDLFLP